MGRHMEWVVVKVLPTWAIMVEVVDLITEAAGGTVQVQVLPTWDMVAVADLITEAAGAEDFAIAMVRQYRTMAPHLVEVVDMITEAEVVVVAASMVVESDITRVVAVRSDDTPRDRAINVIV
jgi:hypothetical protein